MATNTRTGIATLADAAAEIGADRNQLQVVDVLSQKTILGDAHWVQANDFTTHHYAQTLSEPQGTDTIINQGVTYEIGTERPVTEIIQGLESYSNIDARILKMHPNPAQFRRQKDTQTVRGLGKSVDDRLLYGHTTLGATTSVTPAQILGLQPRFNKLTPAYNQIQGIQYWPTNVISATGSASNVQSSAWAIKWGDDGLFLTYPREGKGFIEVDPKPSTTFLFPATGKAYEAWITHFEIMFGLCVGDWRNIQRMGNIDSTHKWTSDLMIQLLAGFPDGWDGVTLYVSRTDWVYVQQEAKNNANSFHFDEAPWGGITPYFMTIPIKFADRLVQTEPVVS